MAIRLHVPTEDDYPDFMRPVWRGFGQPDPSDAEIDDTRLLWEFDRGLAAHDGQQWIGATGAYSMHVALPGRASLPAAGITMVGVASTHRRRGVLTALMERQLADVVDRGEALAVLTASETGIYGRYGYGLATTAVRLEIDATRGAYRMGTDVPDTGRMRMLTTAEAAAPVRQAYERCLGQRAGEVSRNDEYWAWIWRDPERRREGGSALFVVVHEDATGQPDGYATYRVHQHWSAAGIPSNVVTCSDLYGVTPDVEAALWRLLLDVDLSDKVVGEARPVDDPIRWRLAEPRRCEATAVADWLWLRVLDVEKALTARGYEARGTLVMAISDPFRPATSGIYRLDVGPDGATCTRTDAAPDLTLAIDDLGALYLGGVSASTLAAARRVRAHTPDALATADALFDAALAPHCATHF